MKTSELHTALQLAERLLDQPNADPDDDLRTLARHLTRQYELHHRYERALWQANGRLIQIDREPVKLQYGEATVSALWHEVGGLQAQLADVIKELQERLEPQPK